MIIEYTDAPFAATARTEDGTFLARLTLHGLTIRGFDDNWGINPDLHPLLSAGLTEYISYQARKEQTVKVASVPETRQT